MIKGLKTLNPIKLNSIKTSNFSHSSQEFTQLLNELSQLQKIQKNLKQELGLLISSQTFKTLIQIFIQP